MKQRLTLYVNESLVEKAKIRAVLEKTSLSQIFERLLDDYISKKSKGPAKTTKK